MSVTYKGASSELIILPGEIYTEAPNGLITLNREYSCAASFADTASDSLALSSAPSGYSGRKRFTKTRKDNGPITTFSCVYTGASGAELVTFSQVFRSFSYPNLVGGGSISGRYISPTRTVSTARTTGSEGASDPSSPIGSIVVTEVNFNGYHFSGGAGFGTTYYELSSYSSQVFGDFEVVNYTHCLATTFG